MSGLRAEGQASLATGTWIEIGRARLTPEELASLGEGAVVALDAAPGGRVRIFVDGRLAAQGRLVVDHGRPAVLIEK